MEGPNFASILDQQVTDAEPPKPFPVGVYLCMVKGLPRFDKSTKKGTPFVEFTLQPVATIDVDETSLEEFGGLGGDKTLRDTYYLTPDAMWRLRKFLESLGLEVEGKSFTEAINEAPGCSLSVTVGHQMMDDGRTFAVIKTTEKA